MSTSATANAAAPSGPGGGPGGGGGGGAPQLNNIMQNSLSSMTITASAEAAAATTNSFANPYPLAASANAAFPGRTGPGKIVIRLALRFGLESLTC